MSEEEQIEEILEEANAYNLRKEVEDHANNILQKDDILSNKLNGASIVISGVFENYSRNELKNIIEKHGGKNVGSISKKTTFVLAGTNMGPSKKQKAKDLGVLILTEKEFLAKLN